MRVIQRPLEDGRFDELVAYHPDLVHFEMMSNDHLWIGITQGKTTHWHINITCKGNMQVEVQQE